MNKPNNRLFAALALLTALALNACATGGAGTQSESETTRLARELAETRQQLAASHQQYDQAYRLVVRQNAGGDVSAEAAQLPPPVSSPRAVPPATQPTRPTRVAAPAAQPQPMPTPVAAPTPPPMPVMDTATSGGQPLAYTQARIQDILTAPETGVIGNVAWMGPVPPELAAMRFGRVAVTLHGVGSDVQIIVDGQIVCPTMDGRTTPRIVLRNRRATCVVPALPGHTRELTLFFSEVNQPHEVELRSYVTSTIRPVGQYNGRMRDRFVPGPGYLIQAVDGWFR